MSTSQNQSPEDVRLRGLIASSLVEFSSSIAQVLDDRLSAFKRELSEDPRFEVNESEAKRFKTPDKPLLKSEGNKQQFEHEVKVLEKFEDALSSLEQRKYDRAKEALSEGRALVNFRLKLIRIADKSDCGWTTVNEYVADELAENSDDEKRLYRSEQRAQRKIRKTRQYSKRQSPKGARSFQFQQPPTFRPSLLETNPRLPSSNGPLGPCFFCGRYGHLQSKCPDRSAVRPLSDPTPYRYTKQR